MQNSGMWSDVIRVINENQRFIVTTHTNPDLDALGSELALDEYLRSLGKQVSILNSDSAPRTSRFADPERRLRTFSPKRHQRKIERAEVIFVLDASGGWERVGRIGQPLAGRAQHPPDRVRRLTSQLDSISTCAALVSGKVVSRSFVRKLIAIWRCDISARSGQYSRHT